MSNFSSKTRVDLGVQCSIDEPELFNELNTIYKALRALHLTLAENETLTQIDLAAVQTAALLDFYTLNSGSRLIMQAGSNINAGSFVGYRAGESKLEMVNQRAPSVYTANILGWAVNAAAVNDPVVVYVTPSIIPFFTGLSSGALYYGTAVGGMSTNPTGPGGISQYPIGIALTDKIFKIYSLTDLFCWR